MRTQLLLFLIYTSVMNQHKTHFSLFPTQIYPTRPLQNLLKQREMATSDGIKHRSLHVNGINMHVVEKGDEGSPVVLFIHGFPELWYSWRHQILSLSALGYRAVAPDMRGYGDTEAPSDARKYTYVHIVGDLVALIDELGVDQVFVVGHDWGAVIGWWLCLFRPDRVKAFVSMSVAFSPRNPNMKLLDMLCAAYGPDYYICRFQVSFIAVLLLFLIIYMRYDL